MLNYFSSSTQLCTIVSMNLLFTKQCATSGAHTAAAIQLLMVLLKPLLHSPILTTIPPQTDRLLHASKLMTLTNLWYISTEIKRAWYQSVLTACAISLKDLNMVVASLSLTTCPFHKPCPYIPISMSKVRSKSVPFAEERVESASPIKNT